MYAKVAMLRRGGRRLQQNEGRAQIEGFLKVSVSTSGLVATIVKPLETSMPPGAILHDVRLLGIREGQIRLRGFEEHAGSAVLQEWECEVIDVSNGFNAAGERLTDPLPWLAGYPDRTG